MDALKRALDHIPSWDTALDWSLRGGLRILLIALLTSLSLRAARAGIRRLERHLSDTHGTQTLELAKRARTLGDLLRNLAHMVILAIAALMVLRELNVDIMPILTGAGIMGLAIGFGAQTLVKDVISGFFLILEDQIRVGDMAEINGAIGMVEAIHLRTIVLRDMRGAVHVFPCGGVTTLVNLTKDYSYAVLDLQVSNKHDTDEVVEILKTVAEDLRSSEVFGPMTMDPLEVVGLENLAETSFTIRVRIKTQPLKQWDIAREFRRRIKKAFDAAGIESPLPHQDIVIRHLSAKDPSQ